MKRIPQKLQPWFDARQRFKLTNAEVQMARELGMNPGKFGSLANERQEPWKVPLREFIANCYQKSFGRDVPQEVRSLERDRCYHYYRDKDELLVSIAEGHVTRLVELVQSVEADDSLRPLDRLEVLITRFLIEYADAQNSHRVLTEDVKYLPPEARQRIVDLERTVVQGFADAVAVQRPDVLAADLHKAVAMLLFGMLNWMFTWLQPDGKLTHASIAPLVCDIFFRGLAGVRIPAEA